jgi:tyrosine-protein phosphatase YwqE
MKTKLFVEIEFNESWERWTTELPEKAIEMVMAGNHEGVTYAVITSEHVLQPRYQYNGFKKTEEARESFKNNEKEPTK